MLLNQDYMYIYITTRIKECWFVKDYINNTIYGLPCSISQLNDQIVVKINLLLLFVNHEEAS